MKNRVSWWAAPLCAILLLLLGGHLNKASSAPLPGGTLNPEAIPKYVTPLVIPPVMPTSVPRGTPGTEDYDIAVRQFQQQILPGGIWNTVTGGAYTFPPTMVWSYGNADDPMPDSSALGGGANVAPAPNSSFNYPAFTVENISGTMTKVRWINELVQDPMTCFYGTPTGTECNYLSHLLPVDQTLHWANPPKADCIPHGMMTDPMRTDCETLNDAPYTGPVPIVTHVHGAHVNPQSDGYPEAWWLPAADNIPGTYATSGTLFGQWLDDGPNSIPGSAFYAYENTQPATTIWYHDHSMGMTRLNVYAGPAGFWLVRDGLNDLAPGILPGPAPVTGDSVLDLNAPASVVPTSIRDTIREIPIVMQDRSFDWVGADGTPLPAGDPGIVGTGLWYPTSRTDFDGFTGPYISPTSDSDISGIWNPEAFFNTFVVNGVTWPVLEVAQEQYRFRLLNGCNSRTLNIKLREVTGPGTNGIYGDGDDTLGAEYPFFQIGGDQGFLPSVVMIRTGFSTPLAGNGTIPAPIDESPLPDANQALLMMPAERADVIVDFAGIPNGTRIRVINTADDAPFGGLDPIFVADPGTTGQVMEFVVNSTINQAGGDPSTPVENIVLPAEAPLGPAINTRKVSLNEMESDAVCIEVDAIDESFVSTLFVRPLDAPNAATFVQDCLNWLPSAGPTMSVPAAPRQALLGNVETDPATGGLVAVPSRWMDPITETPLIGTTEMWEIYNTTMDAHPIHVHLVRFQIVEREDMSIDMATGVMTPLGTVSQPLPNEVGFKDTVVAYPDQITRVKATFDIPGLYVWHCHIVEHEDNEMMLPYRVMAEQAVAPASLTVPATANPDGSITVVAGPSPTPNVHYVFEYKQTTAINWLKVDNGTGTSLTVNGLTPAGLYEFRVKAIDGNLITPTTGFYADSEYTLGEQTALVPELAVMLSPTNGVTLSGNSQTFNWSAGTADLYQIYVGTTPGSSDLGRWPAAATTGTSVLVPALPTDGSVIHVRLYSRFGTVWAFNDYSYTAWTPPTGTTMISPADTSTLTATSATFTWNNVGADLYQVYVGTTQGTSNLGRWPATGTTSTSVFVPALPDDGSTVYVRLWTKFGANWVYNDYSYTAWTPPTGTTMISPTDASTLTGGSATFTWNDIGAELYQIYVGTTQGANDLGRWPTSGSTATSVFVPALPIDGSTVHVRLWSRISGTWVYNDYSYSTAP